MNDASQSSGPSQLSDEQLAQLPPAKRQLVELLMAKQRGLDEPTPRSRRDVPVPQTAMQQRLWTAGSTDHGRSTGVHALRLRGPLDVSRLRAAVDAVADRHEALRARFVERHGQALQVVEPRTRSLVETTARDVEPSGREGWLRDQLASLADQELAIDHGETMRLRVVRFAEEDHGVLIASHLAVFDGWSSAVFLRELGDAYAGAGLGDEPLQLADVAAWQRAWLDTPDANERIGRLRETLGSWQHPPAATPFMRRHRPATIDPDQTAVGFAAAAADGATPYMALLAALAIVVTDDESTERLVVGTPAAGRFTSAMEGLIGQVTTVVPLVIDCPVGSSFREVLRNTRTALSRGLAYQRIPVDVLLERLSGSRAAPYAVLCALHNYPAVPLTIDGLDVASVAGPPARHLELYSPDPTTTRLSLGFVERDGIVGGTVEYHGGLISDDDVTRLLVRIGDTLDVGGHDPDRPLR